MPAIITYPGSEHYIIHSGWRLMQILDGRRPENLHFRWSADLKPALRLQDGETFHLIAPDSSTWQLTADSTTEDLGKIDAERLDGAVGPVFVEGAEPGDLLRVDVVDLKIGFWGWSAIISDFGFLKNRFQQRLVIWDIDGGYATTRGDFLKGVRVPVSPFFGVMGVAPADGSYGMIPPQYFGGNMDNKLHVKGSSVFLPVSRKGAMLSVSDPHASQGDGEICGTAIEVTAEADLRLSVVKGRTIPFPRSLSPPFNRGEVFSAYGIGRNLECAASAAVENAIKMLSEMGFSMDEAYVLCSVAGDMRVSEIVDEPNIVVTMAIPAEVVGGRRPWP
jgi:acetamidase/formamidase